MATHSGILAWRIPWTEEPGGLSSTGLRRVRHDLETKPLALKSLTLLVCSHGLIGLDIHAPEQKVPLYGDNAISWRGFT